MSSTSTSLAVVPPAFFLGLLQRRACVLPTWRGLLALLLVAGLAGVLAGVLALRGAYGFLAVDAPIPGGVLVLEGWAPDHALAAVEAEFRRGGYVAWCVTGEPFEKGVPLAEYQDYARLTVATFEKMGGTPGLLQPVRFETVRRDRTYASALTLRAWLMQRGLPVERINVATAAVHARRSRLLYEKAFGPGTRIGVMALAETSFDPERWWNSSIGVRTVVGELIAYVYARCFFRGQ